MPRANMQSTAAPVPSASIVPVASSLATATVHNERKRAESKYAVPHRHRPNCKYAVYRRTCPYGPMAFDFGAKKDEKRKIAY